MTARGSASPASLPHESRWAVALAGAVSLAVAMGIGRFAFTPLLPMMLHDGVIDLHAASWLATANYLGYLVGALLCTFQPWLWAQATRLPPVNGPWLMRAGLIATGLLTLGMALPMAPLWPLLRFAAGVASAFVFVYTSGWCLAHLARLDSPALGGVMYAGPGAGIVASGLFASGMVAWQWRAATGWLILGALAFGLTALVWRIFRADVGAAPVAVTAAAATATAASSSGSADRSHRSEPAARHGRGEVAFLAVAYGLAGFG